MQKLENPEAALHPPLPAGRDGWTVEESFRYCARITRGHYENFPVGSVLIPRASRPFVHAVYAFARAADDFADEMKDPPRQLALLDAWGEELEAAFRGEARHPVFVALRETSRRLDIPIQEYRDLLEAFRMDVTVKRYATFDDVLGYCRYSANPVGRLVLYIHGRADPDLLGFSDSICTALQLANFWQDVEVDLRKDRIYIPACDMEAFGVTERDLLAHRVTDRYRRMMQFEVDRTRGIFQEGRALCERLSGRLGIEIRATWLGGMEILRKVEAVGHDVFRRRPKITTGDKARILLRAVFWRRDGR